MGICSHNNKTISSHNMALKQLRIRFQEKQKMVEKVPRTYEQMCLDKLKEIGIASSAEWSLAMGYSSSNGLAKIIRRIKERMPEKMIIHYDKKPRKYEAP